MRELRWRISRARTFAPSGADAPSHGWPALMAIVNVTPDSFSDDWQQECAPGIHFFITREEAQAY